MGVPSEPVKGTMDTAAEMINSPAPFCLRSVCKKERKLALSFADTMLQPIPCLFGYSQLQNRWLISDLGTLKQIKINALKVNSVQTVIGNDFHDRVSES